MAILFSKYFYASIDCNCIKKSEENKLKLLCFRSYYRTKKGGGHCFILIFRLEWLFYLKSFEERRYFRKKMLGPNVILRYVHICMSDTERKNSTRPCLPYAASYSSRAMRNQHQTPFLGASGLLWVFSMCRRLCISPSVCVLVGVSVRFGLGIAVSG